LTIIDRFDKKGGIKARRDGTLEGTSDPFHCWLRPDPCWTSLIS